jgi:hypothetical protein
MATAQSAGQRPSTDRRGVELGTATSGRTKSEDHTLMEEVVERSNLKLDSASRHTASRLRIAPASVQRLAQKIRDLCVPDAADH